jgi:hypothetical protein
VRTASVPEELHLWGPAIGQGRRVGWILSSRAFKSCSLNKISRLVFSRSLPAVEKFFVPNQIQNLPDNYQLFANSQKSIENLYRCHRKNRFDSAAPAASNASSMKLSLLFKARGEYEEHFPGLARHFPGSA